MRLTLVISSLNSGGAERVLSILANAWAARGDQVTVVTTHDAGRAPDYEIRPDVQLVSVDPHRNGLMRQLMTLSQLRSVFRKSEPDVIISFLNYTNVLVLIASRWLRIPVIVSERLDPSVIKLSLPWSLLRRLTYHWTDLLVAQTATAARRYEPLARERVRVIPNPIDSLPHVSAEAPTVSLQRPTFLAVGRLHHQKGFDILISAMARVRESIPEWQLVILGSGDLRNELEAQIATAGLLHHVLLPGRVANPWPWYLAADVFVLSSRSEGFPNVLCEAMVAGMPVIATDCPSGPSDIITDGFDGLLVPTNAPSHLSAAMIRMATDPELRQRLCERARRIRQRYALTSVLVSWDQAIEEAKTRNS
jgi:glycosyltransferase involved in cell wall biosynthesis